MSNAFRAEWARLLRPRSILGLAVPLTFFPVMMTVLSFAVATRGTTAGPAQHISVTERDLVAADGYLVGVEPSSMLVGIVVLVFFAVTFGADTTHGTLRNLLIREPRRVHLLAGRFLALLAFTAAGLVLTTAVMVAAAWAGATGYDVSTGGWAGFATEIPATWAAFVAATVGWAAVGALLGTLIRPTTNAVAVGAVWALLIESIVGEVSSNTAQWLPAAVFNAASSGATTDAALVALYSTVAFALAAWSLKTRDVLV